MQPTARCQRGRGQVSAGDGSKFFGTVPSHSVSVAESKGPTARSVLVSAIIARMFGSGQGLSMNAPCLRLDGIPVVRKVVSRAIPSD